MEMPVPGAKTQEAFDAIAEELIASTPSQRGKMMGMPCLKAHGKMYAGLWGDALVFKLPEPTHGEALSIKGAALFDPSGQNRPMKEWVAVPLAEKQRWPDLARAAYAYVEVLTK